MRVRVAWLCALCSLCLAGRAEMIPLRGEYGLTSKSTYGGEQTLKATFNDPFAYNPKKPVDPLPQQRYVSNRGYHGTGGKPTLAYSFGRPHGRIFIDLYGRSDCCYERDDQVTVELYRGGWEAKQLQERIETGIRETSAPHHVRVTAKPDTWADRMKIIGHDQSFTLMEIRANGQATDASGAIPPPPKMLLQLAAGGERIGAIVYPGETTFTLGGNTYTAVTEGDAKSARLVLTSDASGKRFGPFPCRPGSFFTFAGLSCRLVIE